MSLFDHLRATPYPACALGVFMVAAYLCLANLDYAALWHDEAPGASTGRNLLEQGTITGWDGRNLVGGPNGRQLNEKLHDVWPPLMYVLNAAGFLVFGVNEIGARVMHALVGLLSLGVLYLLLRRHLPNNPRLIFFIFLFVAWSPQLLLYFRQSRYYAFMAFGVIACFYLYERYWQTRKTVYLVSMTLVAALSFFNHYAGGAATMLSLAAWHLLFRTRETTRQQWAAFAASGLFVVGSGTAWLVSMGVIGGDRSGFLDFRGVAGIGEYQGTTPLVLLRVWIYTRELFTADWISWPVFLWFAGTLVFIFLRRGRNERMAGHPKRVKRSLRSAAAGRSAPAVQKPMGSPAGNEAPLIATSRIVLMGALFALFSAVLSVQPVWAHPVADLRYYVGALPLLLPMKGVCADWAWGKSRIAGAAVIAVLLFTSAGAWPINVTMLFSGERTLGLHLFAFIREIHHPYRDSIRVTSDYLLEHADQDDLVYVPGFADREALTFTTGHRVLFCCVLDDTSPLPRDRIKKLGARLYTQGTVPDWIIIFGKLSDEYWTRLKPRYTIAAQPDVHPYPTQRPELNFHAFTPLPMKNGVTILRLKKAP